MATQPEKQTTSPMRLKGMKRNEAHEEAMKQKYSNVPTFQLSRIPVVKSPLPVDVEGRRILTVVGCDPAKPTLILAQETVERFLIESGEYPDIIMLNTVRFLRVILFYRFFTPRGTDLKIPFGFEGSLKYDIQVRGRKK